MRQRSHPATHGDSAQIFGRTRVRRSEPAIDRIASQRRVERFLVAAASHERPAKIQFASAKYVNIYITQEQADAIVQNLRGVYFRLDLDVDVRLIGSVK